MSEAEAESGYGSYAALFRRRKAWVFTIVPAAALIALYIAFALPAQYRSSATIILEQAAIPEELIKATVNSAADQQIEIIQGRAMTLEALKEVVAAEDPYPDHPEWDADAKAQRLIVDTSVERVDPVTFLPLEKSPAFSLHYQNSNPHRAALIARRLADLFLTYHQRVRIDAAKAGARLLESRSDDLSKELQQIDEQFARLRNQHGGALPDSSGRAEDARYRASRDVDDLERQLRVAQERASMLEIQLGATSPNLLSTKGDLTDVATVRAQLAEAQQRYTPDHPDVKRLQRALAALLADGTKDAGKGTAANNPEYRRIAGQLASARSEVSALQTSVERARSQLNAYTATAFPTAEIARQVADLERRRTSLQDQYQDVQGKLKNAQLGQVVESDEIHAERFSMIRSPWVASSPYSPNRLGVILLGLVLGCAFALVAVAIAENIDATVRGAHDIAKYQGVPVLGSVSRLLRPDDVRRKRMAWGAVTALYLVAAIFVGYTVLRAGQRASIDQQLTANL